MCGGPIVEQATHFIDLLRFFGGEIAQESIKAVAVGPSLPLSDMPPAPDAEHSVRNLLMLLQALIPCFDPSSCEVASTVMSVLLPPSSYLTLPTGISRTPQASRQQMLSLERLSRKGRNYLNGQMQSSCPKLAPLAGCRS